MLEFTVMVLNSSFRQRNVTANQSSLLTTVKVTTSDLSRQTYMMQWTNQNETGSNGGKTYSRRKGRKNMQPERKAEKKFAGAKRGKKCNRWQMREKETGAKRRGKKHASCAKREEKRATDAKRAKQASRVQFPSWLARESTFFIWMVNALCTRFKNSYTTLYSKLAHDCPLTVIKKTALYYVLELVRWTWKQEVNNNR